MYKYVGTFTFISNGEITHLSLMVQADDMSQAVSKLHTKLISDYDIDYALVRYRLRHVTEV